MKCANSLEKDVEWMREWVLTSIVGKRSHDNDCELQLSNQYVRRRFCRIEFLGPK